MKYFRTIKIKVKRQRLVEERLGLKIEEVVFTLENWNVSPLRRVILSGDCYFDVANISCTYALTFNKKLAEDYKIGDIYSLVREGKWTFDQMFTMMRTATSDANGDSKMDINDNYGYSAHVKQVLTAFWISAGEMSVEKDENDIPYLAIGDEGFIDVLNRVFTICYDEGTYYKASGLNDVTDDQVKLFSENRLRYNSLPESR